MLADFQQALADLTASADYCLAVRADPSQLAARYTLSERERARLTAIVGHRGMASACTVYRMNRLAPLAMNLRDTLRALGAFAKPLLIAYWLDHPRGHAHFFLESQRFCDWLEARIAAGDAVPAGDPVPAAAALPLARDAATMRAAVEASCTEPALH